MLDVEVTPRAAAQIEAAARWWVKNRPAAPDALRLDFQEAKEILSRQPGIGAKSRSLRYPELRRVYLSRIRYHVYYEERPDRIVILAFWHTSRGTGPGL